MSVINIFSVIAVVAEMRGERKLTRVQALTDPNLGRFETNHHLEPGRLITEAACINMANNVTSVLYSLVLRNRDPDLDSGIGRVIRDSFAITLYQVSQDLSGRELFINILKIESLIEVKMFLNISEERPIIKPMHHRHDFYYTKDQSTLFRQLFGALTSALKSNGLTVPDQDRAANYFNVCQHNAGKETSSGGALEIITRTTTCLFVLMAASLVGWFWADEDSYINPNQYLQILIVSTFLQAVLHSITYAMVVNRPAQEVPRQIRKTVAAISQLLNWQVVQTDVEPYSGFVFQPKPVKLDAPSRTDFPVQQPHRSTKTAPKIKTTGVADPAKAEQPDATPQVGKLDLPEHFYYAANDRGAVIVIDPDQIKFVRRGGSVFTALDPFFRPGKKLDVCERYKDMERSGHPELTHYVRTRQKRSTGNRLLARVGMFTDVRGKKWRQYTVERIAPNV